MGDTVMCKNIESYTKNNNPKKIFYEARGEEMHGGKGHLGLGSSSLGS